MPKLTANEIKLALAHLTKEERAEVAAFARLGKTPQTDNSPIRGRPRTSKGRDFDKDFLLYYEKFRELMNARGSNLPKHPAMLPPKSVSMIEKGWRAVDAFILNCFPNPIGTAKRMKFYRICIDIIIDYLIERDKGTSVRLVCNYMQNCASLVNRQFPGYAESGLMPLVLSWGNFEDHGEE